MFRCKILNVLSVCMNAAGETCACRKKKKGKFVSCVLVAFCEVRCPVPHFTNCPGMDWAEEQRKTGVGVVHRAVGLVGGKLGLKSPVQFRWIGTLRLKDLGRSK